MGEGVLLKAGLYLGGGSGCRWAGWAGRRLAGAFILLLELLVRHLGRWRERTWGGHDLRENRMTHRARCATLAHLFTTWEYLSGSLHGGDAPVVCCRQALETDRHLRPGGQHTDEQKVIR